MRIAWLGSYRLGLLQPELAIARRFQEHPASWIVNLSKALSKTGDVDLHVITGSPGIRENQTIIKDAITFHVIRYTFPFTLRGFPAYMPLHVVTRYAPLRRHIRKIILKLQPDLIHVHGTEEGYGLAALDVGVRTLVSLQGIVQLCGRVSPSILFRLQAPIERYIVRKSKYFGSRTEWANKFIRKLNSTAKIYDLPEAVNEAFFFRERVNQSTQNLLIVGTILQRKGLEEAMDAMSVIVAKIPSAKLVVVGDGPPNYLRFLKERARSAGTGDHVEWLGFRTAEEIAALHGLSALLLHPSHIDNSPNSVIEAMASGLPVIASNVGGIPSVVEHGVTGVLVEPKNHQKLAEAVISLLQNDNKRITLAENAKKVAFERHLPWKVADKTLGVYEDIISRPHTGDDLG